MAFPQSILDLRVELLLSGTWTDVTSYVYNRDPVTITRGHQDESTQTSPSSFAATFSNRDGRFSPRNPTGAYYGSIGRNTQLRASVPEGASYLRSATDTTSYASTPDSVALSVTGDTEIQIDVTLDNWNAAQILATKYVAASRSWALSTLKTGQLSFLFVDGSSVTHNPQSTVTVPVPALGRLAVKVTLQVNNGAGGHTTTFYTAPTIAGPWTQLGSPVLGTGTVTVNDSTAAVQLGYQSDFSSAFTQTGYQGKIHGFKLLNGIGGTTVASPDFTIQTAGAGSFADAQSNTWTVNATDGISDRKYRFHGEVSAWPQSWDPTGTDVYVKVAASGIMRRLGQGSSPLQSAMYRGYVRLTGSLAPVAYWPCEDGSNATGIASAISGGNMKIYGKPTFAGNSSFLCSNPIPLLNSSAWYGYLPKYTQTGSANVMRFLMNVPAGGMPDLSIIARMYTRGTIAILDLQYGVVSGGSLQLIGRDANWNALFTTGFISFGVNGDLLRVSMEMVNNGTGGVDCSMVTLQVGASVGSVSTNTQASARVGAVWASIFNPGGTITDTAIGHISVQQVQDSMFDLASPLEAWAGETAGNRFSRLCTEENVPFALQGNPDDTVAMGAQTPQKFLDLLQECEDADRGTEFEPRQRLAIGYRSRVSMQNQPAAATLSYSAAQLAGSLAPTDDDQQTRNDVTVIRSSGGSSSRQTLDSGTLSTQSPPNGVGRYDTSLTLNLESDSQVDDMASWILHMGTVDEPRYPVISVDLSRSEVASISAALQDTDIGDLVTVSGTPVWLPPEGISQIVQGLTETLAGYTGNAPSPFFISWTGIPGSPWNVGIAGDTVYGRADTDGSTLHANITSGATSMSVDTTGAATGSPLWTTAAGDFPFDIKMGGEQITVTNITGTSSPQTFTITRSVNGVVKAHTAGEDIRLAFPTIAAL